MMTETEWKVTWFPDDKDHVVRSARSKKHAHEIADKHEMFNPLIESREVVVGDWEIYRGMPATQPALEPSNLRNWTTHGTIGGSHRFGRP